MLISFERLLDFFSIALTVLNGATRMRFSRLNQFGLAFAELFFFLSIVFRLMHVPSTLILI